MAKRPIFVFEGPFDALMINNSFAMMGSDIRTPEIRSVSDGSDNLVFVYDNEPRNREIVARIERCIERGDRTVIWPSNIREKDINDMILSGHDVQKVIESNTYDGLEAKLKFTTWKRI